MSNHLALVLIFLLFFYLVTNKKHFLITLLTLEFMMLIMSYSIYLSFSGFMVFLFLVFITLSACEGALGLSILVSLSRSFGSDYLMSTNLVVYGSL